MIARAAAGVALELGLGHVLVSGFRALGGTALLDTAGGASTDHGTRGQDGRMKEHRYAAETTWTGNLGTGTSTYRDYSRDHDVRLGDKAVLPGSADPFFRGDATRYNPEELLLAALSQCHLLSYLHVCATHGVVVTAYVDAATGTMVTSADGGGAFAEVILHPRVTVSAGSDPELARRLHDDAHAACFIAGSVRFPVRHEVEIVLEPAAR